MKRKTLASILSICLVLSACNLPGRSAPNSSALSTSAAETVQAVLSPEATQTRSTPIIEVTATPTPCEDSGKYTVWMRDDVVYDVNEVNKLVAPGKVFTMVWTFENTGTCTWTSGYKMHFDSGEPITQTESFPIMPAGTLIPPGGTVNVRIPMSAPEKAGTYETVFRLDSGSGEGVLFLGVTTKVGTASQALAAPGDLRYTYDCTSGSVNISLNWVDKAIDEDGYRIYRDGTKLADVTAGSTTYSDIAPTSGKYDYTVAAFNAGGEVPTRVRVNTENCQ